MTMTERQAIAFDNPLVGRDGDEPLTWCEGATNRYALSFNR